MRKIIFITGSALGSLCLSKYNKTSNSGVSNGLISHKQVFQPSKTVDQSWFVPLLPFKVTHCNAVTNSVENNDNSKLLVDESDGSESSQSAQVQKKRIGFKVKKSRILKVIFLLVY